jgi:hypothetical protein
VAHYAQSDLSDLPDHFVQRAGVGELPVCVSPADDPDVLALGRLDHLLVRIARRVRA